MPVTNKSLINHITWSSNTTLILEINCHNYVEAGSSRFRQNGGNDLPDYMVSDPRRLIFIVTAMKTLDLL
jgi:hypothetical protein